MKIKKEREIKERERGERDTLGNLQTLQFGFEGLHLPDSEGAIKTRCAEVCHLAWGSEWADASAPKVNKKKKETKERKRKEGRAGDKREKCAKRKRKRGRKRGGKEEKKKEKEKERGST